MAGLFPGSEHLESLQCSVGVDENELHDGIGTR